MINSIPHIQPNAPDNGSQDEKEYFNKYVDNLDRNVIPVPNDSIPTSLNTYTQIYTHFINIDSRRRNLVDENTYHSELINLPPYPLQFTNASSIISIKIPGHNFRVGDRIALNNIVSKNIVLENVIMVKKNSLFIRILHLNHGLSFHGLYQPDNATEFSKVDYVDFLPTIFKESNDIPDSTQYYILERNTEINFSVYISNTKGSNFTRSAIGNIPMNFINRKHTIYLVFTKNGNYFMADPNSYLIKLKKNH